MLAAGFVAPFASDALIAELSTCGSIMILALGLNMVDLTKFKVLNYLPALIVVPFALWAFRSSRARLIARRLKQSTAHSHSP